MRWFVVFPLLLLTVPATAQSIAESNLRDAEIAAARGDMTDMYSLAVKASGDALRPCVSEREATSCQVYAKAQSLQAWWWEAQGNRDQAISSWNYLNSFLAQTGNREITRHADLKRGIPLATPKEIQGFYRTKFPSQEIERSRPLAEARRLIREEENRRLSTPEAQTKMDKEFARLGSEMERLEQAMRKQEQPTAQAVAADEEDAGASVPTQNVLSTVLTGLNQALQTATDAKVRRRQEKEEQRLAAEQAQQAALAQQQQRDASTMASQQAMAEASNRRVAQLQQQQAQARVAAQLQQQAQARLASPQTQTTTRPSAPTSRPAQQSRNTAPYSFTVRTSKRLDQGNSVWDVYITNSTNRDLQCQVAVNGSMYAPTRTGLPGAPVGLTNRIVQGDHFSPGDTKRYSVVASDGATWNVSGCILNRALDRLPNVPLHLISVQPR